MSRTGDPGNPGMEIGEELAAVQMSPGPRFRMIEYRKPGSAFRAGKQNLWGMRHCHVHPFLIYIHRYRVNVPGGHNPQEILIQPRVTHRPSLPIGVIDERNHGISFAPRKNRKNQKMRDFCLTRPPTSQSRL